MSDKPEHLNVRPAGAVPIGFFEVKNDEDLEFAIEQILNALFGPDHRPTKPVEEGEEE